MSLVFADSFDYGDGSAALAAKWNFVSDAFIGAGGRRGTSALILPGRVRKNIGNRDALCVGCAFFLEGASSFLPEPPHDTAQGSPLFKFMNDGVTYITVSVSSDGSMKVIRGQYPEMTNNDNFGGGQQIAIAASNTWQFFSWNYLEFDVAFAYEDGSFDTYLNGVHLTALSNSDVRTIPYGYYDADLVGLNPEYITQFQLMGPQGKADDLYVFDKLNGIHTAHIGDHQVDIILPDGDGAVSDSEIVGDTPAATRWESVDDPTPDGPATAVRFTAADQEDSYTFADLPYDAATIVAVHVMASCRKSDGGVAEATITNRVNGEEVDAPVTLTPSAGDDYSYRLAPFDESADGAWTLAKVQDSEFGFKRTA